MHSRFNVIRGPDSKTSLAVSWTRDIGRTTLNVVLHANYLPRLPLLIY